MSNPENWRSSTVELWTPDNVETIAYKSKAKRVFPDRKIFLHVVEIGELEYALALDNGRDSAYEIASSRATMAMTLKDGDRLLTILRS